MGLTLIQQTFKDKTNISSEIVKRLQDESIVKYIELIEMGANSNNVVNIIEHCFMEQQKKQMNELSEKIKVEVEKKSFYHEVIKNNNFFIYRKFVKVDDKKFPVFVKECKSRRQCQTWLRLKGIYISF
mgnify:CR=1 FL=1